MKLDYKMSDFKRIDYRKLHIEEQELAYHKRQEEITEAQDELKYIQRRREACRGIHGDHPENFQCQRKTTGKKTDASGTDAGLL